MTARFAWVGAEIIEVSVRSWLLLWVIVTAIWACVFSQVRVFLCVDEIKCTVPLHILCES